MVKGYTQHGHGATHLYGRKERQGKTNFFLYAIRDPRIARTRMYTHVYTNERGKRRQLLKNG